MKRSLSLCAILALYATVALSSCDSGKATRSDTNPPAGHASIVWDSSKSYGGQTYKTVTIGSQTWMAENLNFQVDSSWWYKRSADSGSKYGRLYTWAAVMSLPDSCNLAGCASLVQSKHQGICPPGWHVPSDVEWSILSDYAGGKTAGTKLKSSSGWSSGNGTDTYEFRALPAGIRFFDGTFYGIGDEINFWTSTVYRAGYSQVRSLDADNASLHSYFYSKQYGRSVRCLRD